MIVRGNRGSLDKARADGTKAAPTGAPVQRSAVGFVDVATQHRIDALAAARMRVTSAALGWHGILAEEGFASSWASGEITVASHYLCLSLEPTPVPVIVKEAAGDRVEVMPPESTWFCPAGVTFSHVVEVPCHFAIVTVAPERFASMLSGPGGGSPAPQLERLYGVRSPQLAHLVRALVAEAEAGGPSGVAYVEQVATALAMQIAQHFSRGQEAALSRGGLSGAARRRLHALWQGRLADAPSVDEMARAVGLSASHFQRAFRETFGRSPWQHLLALRLEAARQQLLHGEGVSTVAAALGFADQSHFTRHFRRHFGVTPGRLAQAGAAA